MAQTSEPAHEEHSALQRSTTELNEQAHLGKLSLEISIALNERKTLQDMLTACTETLVRYLDVAFARIWLLNEQENMLELQASSGMYTHLDGAHARVPVGTLKIGRIAAQREAHFTNAVSDDPQVSDQAWARREGMVAFAGYPLTVGERLIGVVAMFSRHPFSTEVQQTLATIANGIALGIERQRMQKERIRWLARERAARTEAEAERQRLYNLFVQVPAIICIFRGEEHIFDFANAAYLQLVGKREGLIGQTVRQGLPELAGQGFFELLDQVYTTGEPFVGKETKALLDRHGQGQLEEGFFDFVYQPTRDASGEIDGILTFAIEVTEQVRVREDLLRSQQRLALAQLVGRIGTFDWDIQHNYILWTPELEALYGLPPGGFEGKYENWAQRVHPDDLERAENNLQAAVHGGPSYNIEFRVVWPDGTIRWLLAKGEITAYAQNQAIRMIGVNIDITERKESEEQLSRLFQEVQNLNTTLESQVTQRTEALQQTMDVLQKLNTELARSNQELQDFAYVASHDLQEPLRKIQAFGNLLEEEHGEALGRGKTYLDRMRNAATRMRVLIDDLLTFSRVTTKALPFGPVDLAVTAREVLEDLESRLHDTQGSVEVGDLPTIDADPQQMHQLLQNLIGNALKFHRPDVPPVVKVSAQIQAQPDTAESDERRECMLMVEDNGIGFDEKYLDRIFTVFQRLHGRGDYAGTGVGLAIVRKIVERHSGTITAKSTIGAGSTFIVTLPVSHE